ncbi:MULTISPECIES: molybdopterin-synthase adenylyltransferase MoeB [unclassified Motilimonas]|uniref:HesA/MoeB/ThiF family protein n=1 Tax=Motilimonas TaxID=1914248 RepID=UPI001E4BB5EC|nr:MULTISPECIES: molybdopterin-synthase adenylyltransferase MoeB [unclassified Motilimonas]MCE0559116.1 molybdopterin-synthase adenylyltransferase MoeB [Motilimonas sp. E26]MDO6527578.1 molybdopterin-synthase adenylyltransferase MoeB [Motilimonas sp. 1_MG-2023]
MLSDAETLRYSRHLLLSNVGEAGQLKLKQAKVLIMGMGGLGAPASMYLAAAGVGNLVLADFDELDVSNLQRQISYDASQVGLHKVDAAKARLAGLNCEVRIRGIKKKMDAKQLAMEVAMADLVLDCTDNLSSRHLISQVCCQAKKPLIVGAGIRLEGQLMMFDFSQPDSACYHCLFPSTQEQTLNCSNSGVLGPIVGTIGSLQALEAIKYLVGLPSGINNQLKLFDGLTLNWQSFAISRDPACPVCSAHE